MEKMSDLMLERVSSASEATAGSCLAVAEKKAAQSPGGCVGIFFQLFDWNRRFAKKKFLPKRILHLARSKQVSKRFIVDEKLPKSKHFLIAEESNGALPGIDGQAKKREMKDPGLVARLMGLETIPAVQKYRKLSVKGTVVDENRNVEQRNSSGAFGCEFEEEAFGLENKSERHDWRPQKIRKTGMFSERGSAARFGADALQIKKVISRSRKPLHHKLDSPVISPRGGRNTSRLIGAATRILEPGLQATNRARCSIRYSNPMFRSVQEENPANHFPGESACSGILSSSLQRPGSCTTCGNSFGEMATKLVMEEHAPLSEMPSSGVEDAFFQGLADCKPRSAASREKEIEVVLLKSIDSNDHYASQSKTPLLAKAKTISPRVDLSREGPDELYLPTGSCILNNGMFSVGLKQSVKPQMQKAVLFGEHRLPPRIRLASEHSRRAPFVINRGNERNNSSNNLSPVENSSRSNKMTFEASRVVHCGISVADDSSSTTRSSVREKRTVNAGRQNDDFGSASSITESHRIVRNTTSTGAKPRLSTNPTNHYRGKIGQGSRDCSMVREHKDVDVMPKRSNAPLRPKSSVCPPALNSRKGDRMHPVNDVSQPMLSAANCGAKYPQSSMLLNQDALGALLEQKLKELTRQAEEESQTGIISSTRTTASILQELIAAMTEIRPTSQDNQVNEADKQNGSSPDDTIVDTAYQARAWINRPYAAVSVEDHSSPGSVLGASFSNGSCISSSADDTLGNALLQTDCMDFENDKPQSNSDFLDSASSAYANGVTFATQLLNHISLALRNANLADTRPSGTKLDHTKCVISNLALLFTDIGSHGADEFVDFLLGPFLDELGTFARRMPECSILDYDGTKDDNLFRSFLLDCIMECMDLRCRRHWSSGFNIWFKLPRNMNPELLIQSFSEETRKWMFLSGKPVDEIIELEMSTSLGKWTRFEIEGFESGTEISQAIVQTLVEEVVVDLLFD